MSTIIIVLLVIVLIVAIILKKREGQQKQSAAKKTASKTVKKAPSRTTLVQEELESSPAVTTPISESLRQKLNNEIQHGNYLTAEAQINQALKQDNAQHELYLFLLDIHLAQKDEFAIDQLIKHLHALKLVDIAQAAELKKKENLSNAASFESIEFDHQRAMSTATHTRQEQQSEFDLLTQASATPTFDDLQSEYIAPAEPEKAADSKSTVEPLDFNFSFEQKETPEPAKTSPEVGDKQPLTFTSNLDATPAVEETQQAKEKSSLDFNFGNLELAPNQPENEVSENHTETLQNEALSTEQTTLQDSSIALEKAELNFEKTEKIADLEANTPSEPVSETVTLTDPLIQSFPDLQQLDEAQLNLDLAEQYIELGAYESAQALLQNSQSQFNAEQQQRSQKLLNQIAS
ncbi:FimV domain-containing protein [Acinetobacter suaedae]|uniref:FimV domain-containing protein n=1 Tax=Acinetobacter suaedae TaxID=2609668 RepID=A0A5P1UUJ8_9GAMM|nr:FimV/HubP family polar landmark protein [Acinetobacter sp. C16S1]QER40649.1 FimV domain-containing protein [Acinetobacter sp. C16S1]